MISRRACGLSTVDLMLLTMALIWGVNFTVVKKALEQFSPLSFNSIRFSLATIFLAILVWIFEGDLSFRREDIWRLLQLGVVGNTLYQLCFINGIALTTASNTALILATTPVFVALLGRVSGVERAERRIWFGVFLSLLGIFLITFGFSSEARAGQTLTGDFLILAATGCWSAYTVLSKPLLQRYSPMKLTALGMVTGTPFLVLFSTSALLGQNWGSISWEGWLGLVYSFSLAISIAYVIWYAGVSRIGGARTAIYSNLTPIIAAATASVFLGERMTPLQILGATLAFASIYLTRASQRAPSP